MRAAAGREFARQKGVAMRDGRTRKHRNDNKSDGIHDFLAGHDVRIVVVAGGTLGQSYPLSGERVMLGRGPGVDLTFDDPEMSRQHAAIEYTAEGFRLRDLGSTNGVFVGGKKVEAATMKHGDRFEIGSHGFQLVIEERETTPETYELTVES